VKRLYLDALIESYLAHYSRGGDVVRNAEGDFTYRATLPEYAAAREEVARLCEVQRGLGQKDYFERLAA
jgi:hypothetical protein